MSSETENSAPIDRISNLPDELICHILSFLPIQQAFATKFLSKRWALHCYSLSVLSFLFDDGTVLDDDDQTVLDDDDTVDFYWFCHLVDILMLSPLATNKNIKTFDLKCLSRSYNICRESFHAWVKAAKERHVKEFHLFLNNVTLNPTIFTSQTLVVLKLEGLKVESETLYVDLPSLKTLHLRFVRFRNKKDLMKLLNACPILEDLHTSHPRYVENNEAEVFETLFLSKLVRADVGPIDVPFNAISKVEFLRIDYTQKATLTSIPVFQNLIHIELLFYHFFLGWDSVIELLQHCPMLQILNMKKWSSRLSKNWKSPIPSIECISSHLKSCTLLNFDVSENDLRFATYILQNARLLEVMKINFTASFSFVKKHQIVDKLSTCPRMSMGCNLLFESIW